MIRHDFVSNSSSSSFVIFRKYKEFLNLYCADRLKYPEFVNTINYYNYCVIRKNINSKILTELNDYLSSRCDVTKYTNITEVESDSEVFHGLQDYISTDISLHGIEKKFVGKIKISETREIDDYIYIYNGNSYEYVSLAYKQVIADKLNNEFIIYDFAKCSSNPIIQFLKQYKGSVCCNDIIDYIAAIFTYKYGDEYDTFPLPPELDVMLKYNNLK